MKTTVALDDSNRIVLSRELRRAAGFPRGQKLQASAKPGRIVLEIQANASGLTVKHAKIKAWTGPMPATAIGAAVRRARR